MVEWIRPLTSIPVLYLHCLVFRRRYKPSVPCIGESLPICTKKNPLRISEMGRNPGEVVRQINIRKTGE